MKLIAPSCEQLAQRVRWPRIDRRVQRRAGPGGRRVEARRDLDAGALAVPALERVGDRLLARLADLDRQPLAAAPHVRADAAGLDADAQLEALAEVGHESAVGQVGDGVLAVSREGPLDPVLLLGDERLHVAQRHPARDDDLDPVSVDDDPRASRAVRAPDSVRDRHPLGE